MQTLTSIDDIFDESAKPSTDPLVWDSDSEIFCIHFIDPNHHQFVDAYIKLDQNFDSTQPPRDIYENHSKGLAEPTPAQG